MPIQRLSARDVTVLRNPGKDSEQLVWPKNAPDSSLTITRVTMQPGAISTVYTHPRSEQIWLIERGTGTLLMDDGAEAAITAGDIVRTPAGEAHGVINSGRSRSTISRSPRRRKILQSGTARKRRAGRWQSRRSRGAHQKIRSGISVGWFASLPLSRFDCAAADALQVALL